MALSGGKRAEVMDTIKDAAEKAGTLTTASLVISGTALVIAVVVLVIVVKAGKNAGS